MAYIYIQWNIIQPLKKEILPFVMTQMNLEVIILSKISQTQKMLYDFNYEWNIKTLSSRKQRGRWWLPGSRVGGKGEVLVETSSYD